MRIRTVLIATGVAIGFGLITGAVEEAYGLHGLPGMKWVGFLNYLGGLIVGFILG